MLEESSLHEKSELVVRIFSVREVSSAYSCACDKELELTTMTGTHAG